MCMHVCVLLSTVRVRQLGSRMLMINNVTDLFCRVVCREDGWIMMVVPILLHKNAGTV